MNYWVIAFPCLIYLAGIGMCSCSPPGDSELLVKRHRSSDWYRVPLPGRCRAHEPAQQNRFRRSMLFDFPFA